MNSQCQPSMMHVISANTHNLKNVSVEIPRDSLVVLTGRSGSGKSSLAIDTIFAEGQRQYIESLSLFARQFFPQNSSTEVEEIDGLQPTICIEQNRGAANPRSTVGTLTEIYDYLRLLMAKIGQLQCPECGSKVAPQTIEEICNSIASLPQQTKVMILAPMVLGRKGKHVDVFETIRKERLVRVRVNGDLCDIDQLPELAPRKTHDIEAITDRVIVRDGVSGRLFESVEAAVKLSGGMAAISFKVPGMDDWQERFFNTKRACTECGTNCPEIEPRSFSFNSPHGACMSCDGLGSKGSFDVNKLVPDRACSLDSGAIVVWNQLTAKQRLKRLQGFETLLSSLGVCSDSPIDDWSEQQWQEFVNGMDKGRPGLLTTLEKEWATCVDEERRLWLEGFRANLPCQACQGSRLNPMANAVRLAGATLGEICAWALPEVQAFFQHLELDGTEEEIARPVVRELRHRLDYLLSVGVDYLSLERSSDSLSGGELQRVRLATSIGSGLSGVCYVLDEPSVGLHPRDNERLIEAMCELRDRGNSLLVVEHDETMIRKADHVIDMGPDAGAGGGRVVAEGDWKAIESTPGSLTGDYLGKRRSVVTEGRLVRSHRGHICIRGARGFNLKNVDVDLPLGVFNCITGVSGSGKSTLIYRTLAPAIRRHLDLGSEFASDVDSIEGLHQVDRLIEVDQRPISRTSRGCAATYTGIFDDVRKIYASTAVAKRSGYSASRFSFNAKAGRCAGCEGLGLRSVSMKFMPDVHVTCEMCNGMRFNAQTLRAKFRGHSIADVLHMSVDTALVEFDSFSRTKAKLQCLQDVGLGYLTLGQPSNTLSGGEAQRIKLAAELASRDTGNALYLLDEPTTGLHFDDTRMLLKVLDELVEKGNTVVVIEHNVDVMRSADWIIDLGPDGGQNGGRLLVAGTPADVSVCSTSHTAHAIRNGC